MKKYIEERLSNLGAHNFKFEFIDQTPCLTFSTSIKDFESLALIIHNGMNKNEIKKRIKKFQKELFDVIDQGSVECDCSQSKDGCCNCEESESNVAWGLGFSIDDDGHWIPTDINSYNDIDLSYPDEYEYENEKRDIIEVSEYQYFMVLKNKY